ncbi:hypothetical protein [Polaribacter sp. Z022]|uniref:hypothetical protein n=1 Tax=Polaribacter sp. Z022 TaxID=2927125 RepID=UPI002021075A|nr:hypothetical protein [Polaribacter sp. Z022]MCL7755137.1 hypothetical protein [Polaribacter sp. Z022]
MKTFKEKVGTKKFIKEPLFKYGIDSEKKGLTFIEGGKKIFFVWKKQGETEISEIIVLDKSISINNISVGKTFNDFLKINPNSKIELDVVNSEYEYSVSKNGNYTVEFISNEDKVAEYNKDYTAKRILNKNAKIDRIRISKKE